MLIDHAPITVPLSAPASAPTLADPPAVRMSLHPRPSERPIFLDPAGRRARRVKLASGGVAAVTALWLVGLVAGPVGFLALPPVPPVTPPVASVTPTLMGVPPLRPVGTGGPAAAPLRLAASILGVEPASGAARTAPGYARRSHRRLQLT